MILMFVGGGALFPLLYLIVPVVTIMWSVALDLKEYWRSKKGKPTWR